MESIRGQTRPENHGQHNSALYLYISHARFNTIS
jgi:signal recognition particle subunit SRP9